MTYRGFSVRVPRSWPVYNLAAHPSTCVRFNRHAVYLGTPGPAQACPTAAIGRTEAILVGPAGVSRAAGLNGAAVTQRTRHGVSALATWGHSPNVIRRALGFASLHTMIASAPGVPGTARISAAPSASAARASAVRTPAATADASMPGQVYTGKGFDVCSTPSTSTMSAWGSSPYRAIGVYIGGINRACSQPNLTTSWVQQESIRGWHLIPIYVGRQAPTSGCGGCVAISSTYAASEGTAAATDAVAQAQAVGIGPGNPLYFDMENYTRTTSSTHAVLAFLSAWTSRLHAEGYRSAVYSNDPSGISDLVSQWNTGYPEPDELWAANWNGVASTDDAYIPSTEWANHRRLHQYSGGVNQTYGGVMLNIDEDYVDAPTASGCSSVASSGAPVNTCPPRITGYVYAGQMLTEQHGSWSGSPTSYSYQWYRCTVSATPACAAIAGAAGPTYVLQAADVGSVIRVSETAGNPAGPGAPAVSMATPAVQPAPTSSYWLTTAYGNVYNGLTATFYGSAARSGDTSIVGIAATRDHHGYWLVDAAGRVFTFGAARSAAAVHPAHPVAGIVAAPRGGFYLFTRYGNVYTRGGARFFGSAARNRVSSVVGMALTPDGRGYWLVKAGGRAMAYGDAGGAPVVHSRYPIKGIVASAAGGYWLYTAHGNIYNVGGAPFFGSPFRNRVSNVSGMMATPDGQGYRTVQSTGQVRSYGDAEGLPAIRPGHAVIAIAG